MCVAGIGSADSFGVEFAIQQDAWRKRGQEVVEVVINIWAEDVRDLAENAVGAQSNLAPSPIPKAEGPNWIGGVCMSSKFRDKMANR